MGYSEDDRGKPTYNDDAVNAGPVSDFQKAADWADAIGGLLKGTSAARSALTAGQVSAGWLFVETDTGRVYRWIAGAWQYLSGGDRVTAYRSNTQIPGVSAPITATGVASGTTTAGGVLGHTFPAAFPTACVGVLLMPDHQSGFSGSNLPYLVNGSVSRTGFQSFWTGAASTAVNVAYIAYGY